MDNIRCCYEILGLKPGSSQDEIKQAYKDLAFVWHPDRYSHNPRLQQKAQDKLKEIISAYEFLNSYNSSSINQVSHSQSQPPTNEQKVKLTADCNKLEKLLSAKEWKEADLETKTVMLKVANRENVGWLRLEDIKKFPCQDLQAIDKLWVKYSNGNFGLSVQKNIWHRLGCKADPWMPIQTKSECIFGNHIGWYVNNSWLLQWHNFSYNQAIAGSLPREYIFILSGWWSYSHSWTGYLLWEFNEVFLRLNHYES